MCGVSVSTVSNVLNGKNKFSEEVKEKVMSVVEKTGYQPNFYAQGIRRLRTQTIGIIVEDMCQFTSPHIVESILNSLERNEYKTVLMNLRMYSRWSQSSHLEDTVVLQEQLKSVLKQMQAIKVDGIIYVAAHTRRMNVVPKDFPIPTVVAYGYEENKAVPSVIIDDVTSAKELVEYIISKGHTRIGVVAGTKENFHTEARIEGLKEALKKAGLMFDESDVLYGNWFWESGCELTKKLIDKGVTAIWCMSDRMATGAYIAAQELGVTVGRDISIVGFDDHEMAEVMYPPLTTTRLPLYDIGYKAAELLLDLLETPDFKAPTEPIRMKCEMKIRNSVK